MACCSFVGLSTRFYQFTNDSLLASIWLNKRPKKDCRIVIVVCLCGGFDGLIRLVRSEKKSPEFRSLNIEVGKFELNICKWA